MLQGKLLNDRNDRNMESGPDGDLYCIAQFTALPINAHRTARNQAKGLGTRDNHLFTSVFLKQDSKTTCYWVDKKTTLEKKTKTNPYIDFS